MKNSSTSAIRKSRSTSSPSSSSGAAPSIPKVALSKDLRDFVELCLSKEVEFLIVGGYALALHGAPRFTQDIDLFVAISEENAAKLESILYEFGVSKQDVTREDLVVPEQIVQVGRPPNRVDVITSIEGVTWKEAWESRAQMELAGMKCWVIGLDCLLRNKRAAARPQDLVDVKNLESVMKKGTHTRKAAG
jgi:predicted nucleotidyltransferase